MIDYGIDLPLMLSALGYVCVGKSAKELKIPKALQCCTPAWVARAVQWQAYIVFGILGLYFFNLRGFIT